MNSEHPLRLFSPALRSDDNSRGAVAAADAGRARPVRLVERGAAAPMRRALEHAAMECRDIASRLDFPYFHLDVRLLVPPGVPVEMRVDGGPVCFGAIDDSPYASCANALLNRALGSVVPFQLRDASEMATLEDIDGCAIPLHGPRTAHGLLCLMRYVPLPDAMRERSNLFQQAQWLAQLMLERTIEEVTTIHAGNARRALTARQRQVLSLVGAGHSLTSIAAHLGVHRNTVRGLVTRACEKLGDPSREMAFLRMAALDDFHEALFPEQRSGRAFFFASPPQS